MYTCAYNLHLYYIHMYFCKCTRLQIHNWMQFCKCSHVKCSHMETYTIVYMWKVAICKDTSRCNWLPGLPWPMMASCLHCIRRPLIRKDRPTCISKIFSPFSVDIGQGIFRKNFLSLLKSGRRWKEVDLRLGVNNFHQTEQIKSLNLWIGHKQLSSNKEKWRGGGFTIFRMKYSTFP